MNQDGVRTCDSCGQPIPSMSKLATREAGRDLCLACQIREAQTHKGLRH
jgi:predicted CXXCH cytochrome family protein